jgi:hypothetical protein
MYEVFATITDEHGTRCFPTGEGSVNRNVAENLMLRRMMKHPAVCFHVEYVPSEDEFNAY